MNAIEQAQFEQEAAALCDLVPSFLRRFLTRCEKLKIPESLSDEAARMALEYTLTRMDDGGYDGLDTEPGGPRLIRDGDC